MRDQKAIIGLVVLAIILVIGGFLVFSPKNQNTTPSENTNQEQVEAPVIKLSPEEIGLDLTTTNNNRHLVIKIEKPQGIKTIEYELTWGAKVEDKASGSILDVVHGTSSGSPIEINEQPYEDEIKMGTCSDVCHYDEGVNNIKIILKVTKTDGTVAQIEKSL